jgi:hypothetical protein
VTLPLSKLKKNLNLHYQGENGDGSSSDVWTRVAFNADSRLKFTTGDADMGESEKDPAKGYLCYLFCKKESADCLKAGFDAYLKKKGYDFGDPRSRIGAAGKGPIPSMWSFRRLKIKNGGGNKSMSAYVYYVLAEGIPRPSSVSRR